MTSPVLESRLPVGSSVKAGDGYKGWPEHAPFDAIVSDQDPAHQ
jgi:protein-L-isoaspartate O-methyltransferase